MILIESVGEIAVLDLSVKHLLLLTLGWSHRPHCGVVAKSHVKRHQLDRTPYHVLSHQLSHLPRSPKQEQQVRHCFMSST